MVSLLLQCLAQDVNIRILSSYVFPDVKAFAQPNFTVASGNMVAGWTIKYPDSRPRSVFLKWWPKAGKFSETNENDQHTGQPLGIYGETVLGWTHSQNSAAFRWSQGQRDIEVLFDAKSMDGSVAWRATGAFGDRVFGEGHGIRGSSQLLVWEKDQRIPRELTPRGFTASRFGGVSAELVAGSVARGNENLGAAVWKGINLEFASLHPKDYDSSEITCVGTRVMGGYVTKKGGQKRAAIWQNASASFIDVHPDVARESEVVLCSDEVQVLDAKIGLDKECVLRMTGSSGFARLDQQLRLLTNEDGRGKVIGFETDRVAWVDWTTVQADRKSVSRRLFRVAVL